MKYIIRTYNQEVHKFQSENITFRIIHRNGTYIIELANWDGRARSIDCTTDRIDYYGTSLGKIEIEKIQQKVFKRVLAGVSFFDFFDGPLSIEGADEEDNFQITSIDDVEANFLNDAIEQLEKE